jgi:SAM-dependent methyltransferase
VPDLEWNKVRWNDEHPWPESGDEWSAGWGGPRPQWYGAIYPRIARWLPAGRVLEIAPGFGRWTQFLLRHAGAYQGVELSPKCVARCRQRFAAYDRAHFFQNDGVSLDAIADGSIDFAFSFDSLVHVELDVLTPYCAQIVRKLTSTGTAFIHHSNAANGVDAHNPNAEGRGKTVSSQAVKAMIEEAGGRVLVQEEINWGSTARIDCLTTFARAGALPYIPFVHLQNDHFMTEMNLIRSFQSHYA